MSMKITIDVRGGLNSVLKLESAVDGPARSPEVVMIRLTKPLDSAVV